MGKAVRFGAVRVVEYELSVEERDEKRRTILRIHASRKIGAVDKRARGPRRVVHHPLQTVLIKASASRFEMVPLTPALLRQRKQAKQVRQLQQIQRNRRSKGSLRLPQNQNQDQNHNNGVGYGNQNRPRLWTRPVVAW